MMLFIWFWVFRIGRLLNLCFCICRVVFFMYLFFCVVMIGWFMIFFIVSLFSRQFSFQMFRVVVLLGMVFLRFLWVVILMSLLLCSIGRWWIWCLLISLRVFIMGVFGVIVMGVCVIQLFMSINGVQCYIFFCFFYCGLG